MLLENYLLEQAIFIVLLVFSVFCPIEKIGEKTILLFSCLMYAIFSAYHSLKVSKVYFYVVNETVKTHVESFTYEGNAYFYGLFAFLIAAYFFYTVGEWLRREATR